MQNSKFIIFKTEATFLPSSSMVTPPRIFLTFANSHDVDVEIDMDSQTLSFKDSKNKLDFSFEISAFDKTVVSHGGLVNFAVKNY